MSLLSRSERIILFMSLFQGRTDVYARRWEKYDGGVSGYAPAYVDWKKKTHAPLTAAVIERHLLGSTIAGIYPLLEDNASHFIAADFDDDGWLGAATRLWETANKHGLPVYVERSRSGKGGHVWCFFTKAYPAYKSRKIFFYLLRQSRNIDDFDKDDSFDRLFPNQDYHSGKGFGNLIAFPLQAGPRKKGNSVFLDPAHDFAPATDQWEFLSNVEKTTPVKLDALFGEISAEAEVPNTKKRSIKYGVVPIIVSEQISIPKSAMPRELINYVREELNFLNADYIVKQKIGVSVFDTEKYFRTIQTDDANVLVPRGFLQNLITFLKERGIAFELDDKRHKADIVTIKPTFTLFSHQEDAIEELQQSESGVIVAPPGSGKTILGLALIAQKQQPALILTHRKQIFDQWVERIEHFCGIPKRDIGKFVSIKKDIKFPITVAMVQSLARLSDWNDIKNSFGLIIVDECHHMPARMFRDVITKFNPYYLYGLTATPKRKGNDEKLIYAYLGDIIHTVPDDYNKPKRLQTIPSVISRKIDIMVRDTNLSFPFEPKRTDYQTVLKVLTFNAARNEQITNDISEEAKQHNKCLVLTERKDHVDILTFYLKCDFELITLTGDMTQKQREQQQKAIKSGHFQIIVATGQLLGEGTDIANLDCLFLVFPFTFEGKLTQYIGRIQRGEDKIKKVYDYRDGKVSLLDRMFKQRQRYYNKMHK